jgi:hypothetical protein
LEHIIDHAVAIVVFAIADLWLCRRAVTNAPLTRLASLRTRAASRLTSTRRDIVVNQTIAIVILAIADLGLWRFG